MTRQRNGFVLVTTLWVLAIATLLVVGFGHRAFLEARAAAYSLDYSQARLQAQAAVNRGIIEMRNKFYKDLLIQQQGMEASTNLAQSWAQPMALHKEEGFFQHEGANPLDGVWVQIEDADRRINVNSVPVELLDSMKQLNRAVARAIKVRRTEESHKGEGVSMFQALEELRYVRGIKDEDWYGKKGEPGLRDVLTIWGGPQVNINTAPPEVLACIPGLDETTVGAILKYRGDLKKDDADEGEPMDNALGDAGPPSKGNASVRGFSSMDDVMAKTDIRGDAFNAIQQFCSVQSNCFIITGTATRQGGKVRVQCRAVMDMAAGGMVVDWQEVTVGS